MAAEPYYLVRCDDCQGKGFTGHYLCAKCHGEGRVLVPNVVSPALLRNIGITLLLLAAVGAFWLLAVWRKP